MRRSLAAGFVLPLLTAALVTPATPATAATSSVALAPGVRMYHSVFASKYGTQRVWSLRVALSAHTRLVAASPQNLIGSHRATTLAIARQERAVAGINGDTFYFSDPTSVPRGGITHDGRMLKSALQEKNAVLYVTESGRAAIGDPGFAGTVSTPAGRGYKIRSMNSLENARNGGLSLVDSTVLTTKLPNCAIARVAATADAAHWTVRALSTSATRYNRAASGTRALVSCAPATKTWMRDALQIGDTVAVSAGYRVRGITTLLSGARQLIRDGRRYDDRTGINVYGDQRKPETFGCVLSGGRSVLLGVVEGDRKGRAGMTYAQLTTYLLGRGCRSAVVFDGSGSSTLVAKRPGKHLAVQNLTTAPGGPRQVVDGLFVVRR